MRTPLVAGNWKMHGTRAKAAALAGAVAAGAEGTGAVDITVCVPFPHLETVARVTAGSRVALGAQDVAEWAEGAYTGDVSAAMLADCGCRVVIVGHSERRRLHGESDALVAAKFAAARAAGLLPVLCIGETLAEREAGDTLAVVVRQLGAVLARVGPEGFAGAVLAYEPVWAIGTGRTAGPAEAQAVHAALRAQLAREAASLGEATRILYGGSVKASNAAAMFAERDVDGGLIGGAALVAAEFLAIAGAAAQAKGRGRT